MRTFAAAAHLVARISKELKFEVQADKVRDTVLHPDQREPAALTSRLPQLLQLVMRALSDAENAFLAIEFKRCEYHVQGHQQCLAPMPL